MWMLKQWTSRSYSWVLLWNRLFYKKGQCDDYMSLDCTYSWWTFLLPRLLLCLLTLLLRNPTTGAKAQDEGRVGRLLLITGIFMELSMRLYCLCVHKSSTAAAGLECFSWGVRKQGIATDWADWSTHTWESCYSTKCPKDLSHLPHFLASHRSSSSKECWGSHFLFFESLVWEMYF